MDTYVYSGVVSVQDPTPQEQLKEVRAKLKILTSYMEHTNNRVVHIENLLRELTDSIQASRD